MPDEDKTIKQELKELKELIEESTAKKQKKFRLPYKARLNKRKLSEGYATVILINENKQVDFLKEPIIDGTIKINDTYHALKDEAILSYKGKPIIIQAKRRLNPLNPLEGKHETYGQKYVMARMEGDKLVSKKGIGWGISIGAIVIIGIIIYALFTA